MEPSRTTRMDETSVPGCPFTMLVRCKRLHSTCRGLGGVGTGQARHTHAIMTRMRAASTWLAVAILIGALVVFELLRRRRAREIAERWLAGHNYRVRSLRPVYLSARPRFRATPFRNNDWAVDFRAEVDDLRLGGTGEVRLRVWTDLLGLMDREPEISWDRMPTLADGGALTPEMEWENAQMAVLRRVASGDTTWRPEGRDPQARADFDAMVEHILALQRRGLLHCATPIAELRDDAQYAEVADVVVTPEGRRAIERADAAAQQSAGTL